MKHLFVVILLSNFLSFYAYSGENKTVNAPAFTEALKTLYKVEDSALKTPGVNNYSSTPGSSFWRYVRSNKSYNTQVKGDDTGILINDNGEDWRLYKGQAYPITAGIVGLALLIPVLLLLFFGQFKIKSGFSGNVVPRFQLNERIIHWGTASLFIILSITGLTLLLGRYFLVPIIGRETFADIASLFKYAHDVFGPLFILFLVVMIVKFVKDNLYQKGDFDWFLKKGGLFDEHADCWRFNLGEKIWFWIVFIIGLTASISGIILLFSDLVDGQRNILLIANIAHATGAVLMIAGMFGHIYMGIALQGSMSAMTKGVVDKNWAKEHHSLWYEEIKK